MDSQAEEVRARHRYDRRSTNATSAVALIEQLAGLRASAFPDLAVTAYLPVPPHVRWGEPSDMLRELAGQRRGLLDSAQRSALERELPALRSALERDWRDAAGVAVLAKQPVDVAVALRTVVKPRLVVAQRFEFGPLDHELEAYPPSLVVVADKEESRIYASALDRVTRLAIVSGLPIHRHRQGGTSAEQWQNRQDEHAEHNLAQVAKRLERIMRAHPDSFRAIRVAAPPEARAMLIDKLPLALQPMVGDEPGIGAYASDGAVNQHVLAGRR